MDTELNEGTKLRCTESPQKILSYIPFIYKTKKSMDSYGK